MLYYSFIRCTIAYYDLTVQYVVTSETPGAKSGAKSSAAPALPGKKVTRGLWDIFVFLLVRNTHMCQHPLMFFFPREVSELGHFQDPPYDQLEAPLPPADLTGELNHLLIIC